MDNQANAGADLDSEYETPKVCVHPLARRPVLYTDTVGGAQTCRDDLWAVTTDELNALAQPRFTQRADVSAAEARFLRQYYTAAESSKPDDWMEAALLAKQWHCALTRQAAPVAPTVSPHNMTDAEIDSITRYFSQDKYYDSIRACVAWATERLEQRLNYVLGSLNGPTHFGEPVIALSTGVDTNCTCDSPQWCEHYGKCHRKVIRTPAATQQAGAAVAEKWAIYYDNLGEQPYESRFMAGWDLYDSKEMAEHTINGWTHAKHYSPVKVTIYAATAATTASASGELLPCPFCAGQAHVEEEFRRGRSIECVECGANVGAVDLARGAQMWNRRAPAPSQEAVLMAPCEGGAILPDSCSDCRREGTPCAIAAQAAHAGALSIEEILKIVAENTGKRISLSLGDLDCYIAVVRAAIASITAQGEKK